MSVLADAESAAVQRRIWWYVSTGTGGRASTRAGGAEKSIAGGRGAGDAEAAGWDGVGRAAGLVAGLAAGPTAGGPAAQATSPQPAMNPTICARPSRNDRTPAVFQA